MSIDRSELEVGRAGVKAPVAGGGNKGACKTGVCMQYWALHRICENMIETKKSRLVNVMLHFTCDVLLVILRCFRDICQLIELCLHFSSEKSCLQICIPLKIPVSFRK